jgi:protein phosphatase PTC6
VTPMTTKHHAQTPVESTRLRRVMGSALVTDSFGEARWMGVLENTRSLGDFKYKRFGITPEPEVRERLLKGDIHLFRTLISEHQSAIQVQNVHISS